MVEYRVVEDVINASFIIDKGLYRQSFYFDHHFAVLNNLHSEEIECFLDGIFFDSSKKSFSKNKLSKTDLPNFRFF